MVILLAIGPKIRELKPDRERWILTAKVIRSTTSFGGEVKPAVQFLKILQHVKNPYSVTHILVG
jgi:hypothetical protein